MATGIRLASVDGVTLPDGMAPGKARSGEPAGGARRKPGVSSRSRRAPPAEGEPLELRGKGMNDRALVAAVAALDDGMLDAMHRRILADFAVFTRECDRRRRAAAEHPPPPKAAPYDGPRLLVAADEAARYQKGRHLVTEEGMPFRFTGYGRSWPASPHDAERVGRPELAGVRVCYAYGTPEPWPEHMPKQAAIRL